MDIALTVDTTSVAGAPLWRIRIPAGECPSLPNEVATATGLAPVSAGLHTVLLMGKDGGAGTHPSLRTRTLTALFVDQDGLGSS